MGCKTCKNKKGPIQNNGNNNMNINKEDTISLIPEEIVNGDFTGNFMFKVVAFIVMVIAIPLIIVLLIGKMFFTFFMPKSLPKVSKGLSGFFMGIVRGYGKFLANKEVRKRKRQFEKNGGYEEVPDPFGYEDDYEDVDGDLVDITIHEDNNEKE